MEATADLVLETADGRVYVLDVNSMPGLDPDDVGDRRYAVAIVAACEAAP